MLMTGSMLNQLAEPSSGLHTAGPDVAGFVALVIVVAVVAAGVRFVRLPYTVALVLAGLGLALAPGTPTFFLTPSIILTVFLPVLLFHGAYNLEIGDLRAVITSVSLLALPGVVVTAALVGATLHFVTALPWAEALLFGTIVAATDPVAVLAIFGDVGAPRLLTSIVNAESLFNDGTALVLFGTMIGVVTAQTFDLGTTAEDFVVKVLGSLALGTAIGIVGSAVLRPIDDALLETTITLIMAYGGYLLADHLSVSGPIETVAAGLALGTRSALVMSTTTRLQARATWEFLDFLANSLLFLLVGLALRTIGLKTATNLGTGVILPLVVAIVAVVIARAIVVEIVGLILRHLGRPFPPGWSPVIVWAGLRGAVSLAAALSIPIAVPDRGLLLTLTFGIVLFTLLAQGLTMNRLLTWLGLQTQYSSEHDIELLLGRLRTVEAALQELKTIQQTGRVRQPLLEQLEHTYQLQREELSRRIEDAAHTDHTWEREQQHEMVRHLLRVQHAAARDAYAEGQISSATLRELVAEIDHDLGALHAMLDEET